MTIENAAAQPSTGLCRARVGNPQMPTVWRQPGAGPCTYIGGTMSKRVADLDGAELDYWVAKADGRTARIHPKGGAQYQPSGRNRVVWLPFRPSTDWADGGPIIERERIFLSPPTHSDKAGLWFAVARAPGTTKMEVGQFADKPLVAAMRVYVSSKFGDEVPDA